MSQLAHNEHKNIISVSKITFLGVRVLTYDVFEGHMALIIIKHWPLESKIQNGRHCNVICLYFDFKLGRHVFLPMAFKFKLP